MSRSSTLPEGVPPRWATRLVLVLTAVAWMLTIGYTAITRGPGHALFALFYLPIEEPIVLGRALAHSNWLTASILSAHLVTAIVYALCWRRCREQYREGTS